MTSNLDITSAADQDRARQALASVLASSDFARSERLKAFLGYIVAESLSGRSETILGKTIAQDVYNRDPSRTENAENLVRVDAGRLRRKLEAYYAGDGADDPVRIVIDPGGYAPRFVPSTQPTDPVPVQTDTPRRTRARPLALAGGMALLLGAVGLALLARGGAELSTALPGDPARELQRQALAAKSTASVSAANLCDQARGFLFPIAEVESQRIAAGIFERAIDVDPDLACGYAGRAHALATLARLAGPSLGAERLRAQAQAMADRALALEPTSGWSQSAAAWAAYAWEDVGEAHRLSELAVELSPRDGNVLDFRALIVLASGDFDAVLTATDPALQRDTGSFRFARRNLRAVALFHTGDYAGTIRALEAAIRNGDPVSPLTLTYLAVAHGQSGSRDRAAAYARELAETWPDARPDIGLRRLYATQELAEQVLEPLSAAGWRPQGDAL